MSKEDTRAISYTVFDIEPTTTDIVDFNLGERLLASLGKKETVRDRLMKLSSDPADNDNDFISNYSKGNGGFIFGSFIRLKEGIESFISVADLDKKVLDVNSVISEARENSAGLIKDTFFFGIKGNILVLSSGGSSRKGFETYVNWLIRQSGDSHSCRLAPKKKTSDTIRVEDIRSISIGDDAWVNGKGMGQNYESTTTKYKDVKDSILNFLLGDVDKPSDMDWSDMVSATLMLKFKKNKTKKENTLNAALRLIDNDLVKIKDNSGNIFTGGEFVMKVSKRVGKTSVGYYNEKEIEGNMLDIIYKVERHEMVY